jgi:hypothetical protein
LDEGRASVDRSEAADVADDDRLVRVLFRPPAKESHCYVRRSREMYLEALDHLAKDLNPTLVDDLARVVTGISSGEERWLRTPLDPR